MSHKLLIGHCSVKKRLFFPFLAVVLVWAGTALAINVPDGDFDTVPVAGNGGVWDYVTNHDTPWFATGAAAGGSPWVGNNYSLAGYDYPGTGHTGAQWVDLNADYIAQALGGETYEQGKTYKLSVWATTGTSGQGLYFYFTDATNSSNGWEGATTLFDSGLVPVPVSGWTKYSANYTATAAAHGRTIGIAIYGRSNTYADTVTLTSGEPEITSDPVDIVVDETRTAVFTAEHLNGTSYEWHKVATGVVDSGTTTSGQTVTLSISGVAQADAGYYYCKVINDKVPAGVDSAQARLTVTALTCGDWGHLRSDINRDCYVNLLDLVELATKWLNGTLQ